MTCRTSPRVIRSARSSGPSSVDAGMMTAPSFIAARMTSHSGAMLPSMTSTRSPRRAPSPRSQLATWLERAASSRVAEPDVAVGRHHAQRVALGVLGGEHVEPVQRPVEFVKVGQVNWALAAS